MPNNALIEHKNEHQSTNLSSSDHKVSPSNEEKDALVKDGMELDALALLKQHNQWITEWKPVLSYDAPHQKELIHILDTMQQEMSAGSAFSAEEKISLINQLADWVERHGSSSIQTSLVREKENIIDVLGSEKKFEASSMFQFLATQLSYMIPGCLINHVNLTALSNLAVLDAICETYTQAIKSNQFDSSQRQILHRAAKSYQEIYDLMGAIYDNRKEIIDVLERQYQHFRLQAGLALFKCRGEAIRSPQYANASIKDSLKPGANKDNLFDVLNELELRRLMLIRISWLSEGNHEKYGGLDSKETI